MSFNVATSQMISVYIELLTEGQLVILLFFISMTFDVDKGQMIRQRSSLYCVPDFCNHIPIGLHGGTGIRILEVSVSLSPFNHAFVVT